MDDGLGVRFGPNNGLIGVGAVQRECGAKRGRLWREENGAGWRGTAGAELGGGSARFCPLELDLAPRKEKGGTERDRKLRGVRVAKSGAQRRGQARLPTRGAAPMSTVAGMAGERHSAEQEMHCFFV